MDNFSNLIPAELEDDFIEFASDFGMCELCEVYTPLAFCEECQDWTCQDCLDAYGCDGVTPLHP